MHVTSSANRRLRMQIEYNAANLLRKFIGPTFSHRRWWNHKWFSKTRFDQRPSLLVYHYFLSFLFFILSCSCFFLFRPKTKKIFNLYYFSCRIEISFGPMNFRIKLAIVSWQRVLNQTDCVRTCYFFYYIYYIHCILS